MDTLQNFLEIREHFCAKLCSLVSQDQCISCCIYLTYAEMTEIKTMMMCLTGAGGCARWRTTGRRSGRRRHHSSRHQASLPSSNVADQRRIQFRHRDVIGRRVWRHEQQTRDVAVGRKDQVQVRLCRCEVVEGRRSWRTDSVSVRHRPAAWTLRQSVERGSTEIHTSWRHQRPGFVTVY